jgi:hypothetical protein
MSALQTEVDDGHRPGELDPEQVTGDFLVYDLAIPVSNMQDKKQRNGQSDVTVSLQDGRTACAGAACSQRLNRHLVCSEVPFSDKTIGPFHEWSA